MSKKKRKFIDFPLLAMVVARIVCSPLLILLPMKRLGIDGKPYGKLEGPALIVMNHTGFLDPFLAGVCFWRRRMHCWASEEVMSTKTKYVLLKGVGCIKVDRNKFDIQAVRDAVEVLKDKGRLMAVFPQGHIQKDGQVEQVKSGAVLVSFQSGAPIIPVYMQKQKGILKRRTAIIGNAIDCKAICTNKVPKLTDIETIAQKMLEEMNRCATVFTQLQEEK